MTIRVGFWGAGFISNLHHAFLSASSAEHEIVAVHDPDPVRATAFAERCGAKAVAEAELLDLVDAVYVTTWTSEHPRLVEAAAARGLAVFCEKPLARDAPTVEQMVNAVESAGVVNQVNLLLRFAPQFIMAKHLVEDPAAGRLLAVSFRDDQFIPNQGRYASTWRVDPSLAGRGTLLEHSIHDIDILRWIGGEVTAVSAAMREVHGHDLIDDVAVVRLEFATGALASLTSVWHDMLERPSMRHVEIICERLFITIDDELGGTLRWRFADSPPDSLDASSIAAACVESGAAPVSDVVSFLGGSVFNPATAFLAAVAEGTATGAPFRTALPAHRIVDAIYRSADNGGGVITDPEATVADLDPLAR